MLGGGGGNRLKLGKTASEMAFPSKEFHKRLSNLDQNSFLAGNLKDTPISKNVIKQCAYEYRKSTLVDADLVKSLQIIKEKYISELEFKTVPGFLQFFSIQPLTIALWTQTDVELYHKMSSDHCLLVDATGSIATKISDKEIFYFAFLSYDRSVHTEPVAHIEILTELSTSNTLKFILMRFLEDEQNRFNYTSHSVPLLCTTDFSWPIIKTFVGVFNNETIEQYIGRSYLIVSGKATANDLSVTKVKTFVHISLCHVMKAFARKVNKCFKEDKNFIKFSLSLLANAPCFSYILDIIRHLFKILLSKYSSDCKDSKVYLEKKMDSEIESYKKLESDNIDSSGLNSKMYETNIENDDDELPVREVVYLQQSKRSIYFKDCESFFIKIQEGFKHEHARTDDLNVFFSSTFAIYFLNNWCGLIPFWTSIHLGNQGRHGKSEPYKLWSEHFSDRACIKDPPRTQGIIEFHHKSLKHVTLNSKRDRLDGVVSNLLVAKISKHRQFEIAQSRKKSSSKTQEKMKESLPKKNCQGKMV